MFELRLPSLGEGINEAVIACWHVNTGDRISCDDDLVEVVTDKASFNVPTTKEGKIKNILIQAGETVSVGAALAIIDDEK